MEKQVYKFGHGGVITHSNSITGVLKLTQIKPPLEYLGTIKKGDLDHVDELYSVTFTRGEHGAALRELLDALSKVKEGDVLELENVLLDFTKFEEQSIVILRKGINRALNPYWQLALAC